MEASKEVSDDSIGSISKSKGGTTKPITSGPLPPPQIQQGSQRVFPLYEPPKPQQIQKVAEGLAGLSPAAQE